MCGIIGIVFKEKSRPISEPELVSMRDTLFHRGPDDSGLFIDKYMGMGHRRLSIIDLKSGQQPMTNEDESLWIVFNGEIYNFPELRKELINKGHTFKTNSDTEVILHLYEEEGERCPTHLNGIFAFAIWDKKNQSLFLARDHMGIKPLYYAEKKDIFLFSSEIKAIVQTRYFEAQCNSAAIPEFFIFRHISGENTMFQGIKSLLPGHSLLIKNNEFFIKEYWSPFPSENSQNISFDEAVEELTWLIQDSVKKQLISDVPLGTFCSGGIDSSLVTAMASREKRNCINTFSVGFHEKSHDETSYAKMVSNQYGTNHHEIIITNQEFTDLLPKMIWHNDEPLNFANSIHIFAISKLAKEFVTVVLTGEGADELFGGYPRYLVPKMAEWLRKAPSAYRKVISHFGSIIGDHRLMKIARFSAYNQQETFLMNAAVLDRDFISSIVQGISSNGFPYREETIARAEALSIEPLTCLNLVDQQNYLVSILNRQDKMSMATSIESRVPLLDHRIVEFANRLPSKFKIKGLQTKAILKKVAIEFLPRSTVYRKKSGFGVPLNVWFREPTGLGLMLEEMAAGIEGIDWIRKDQFLKLVSEHKAGKNDHSEIFWSCISFLIWKKQYRI